jgi:hypothetical protein
MMTSSLPSSAPSRLYAQQHTYHPFCAPQRMDAKIPAAVHNGGSVRGYQDLCEELAER